MASTTPTAAAGGGSSNGAGQGGNEGTTTSTEDDIFANADDGKGTQQRSGNTGVIVAIIIVIGIVAAVGLVYFYRGRNKTPASDKERARKVSSNKLHGAQGQGQYDDGAPPTFGGGDIELAQRNTAAMHAGGIGSVMNPLAATVRASRMSRVASANAGGKAASAKRTPVPRQVLPTQPVAAVMVLPMGIAAPDGSSSEEEEVPTQQLLAERRASRAEALADRRQRMLLARQSVAQGPVQAAQQVSVFSSAFGGRADIRAAPPGPPKQTPSAPSRH